MCAEYRWWFNMKIERLNKNNRPLVEKAIKEAIKINPLNEDFLSEYDSKSFVMKFLLKSSFDIYISNDSVGYIWYEHLSNNVFNIKSLYFPPSFSELPISFFTKNHSYSYESIANEDSISLLKTLNFNICSESYILEKTIEDFSFNDIEDISFRYVKTKDDINSRVSLQNIIFDEDSRIPLETSDILFDMKQEYYINDLAIIMYFKDKSIGYGQIIKNNSYTVVNFGILPEYRSKGLGRHFLNYIISLAKRKNIKELSIRVSPTNVKAMNLYGSVGFYFKEHILTWNK